MSSSPVDMADPSERDAGTRVSLQINVAPRDLRHARKILPHELRQFADQVDEVLLVMDAKRDNRLADQRGWNEGVAGMRELCEALREQYPHLRLIEVDTTPEVAARVAEEYAGGTPIPLKDWRGAPIYAYFYGLWASAHDYVLHMDSDMLFGGGSRTWIAEAVALLQSRPDVMFCSPLPGPPTASGELVAQSLPREPLDSLAFRADQISSRVFMFDRRKFRQQVGGIEVVPPPRSKVWLAKVDGYTPIECAETMLSAAIVRHDVVRIDFLGAKPGLWSLHPPYRSERFYSELPDLIARIESGDVSDAQRGRYDVDDSMLDWGDARQPKWRRWSHHAELGIRNLLHRSN